MSVEELWQDHNAKLRGYVLSRVKDFHAAEDIMQEVAVRLYKSAGRLKDIANPEQWLHQVARNLIIDYYRRSQADRQLHSSSEPHQDTLPEDTGQNSEAAECLLRLSESLPEELRQALLATDYRGISQKEQSAKMGLTYSGYKSRVQRARRKLKSAMLSCCRVRSDRYGNILEMERLMQSPGDKKCPEC